MACNVVLALSPSSAALTGALAAGGVDLCKADEAEGGGVSLTWHLDTKYYSADVRTRGKREWQPSSLVCLALLLRVTHALRPYPPCSKTLLHDPQLTVSPLILPCCPCLHPSASACTDVSLQLSLVVYNDAASVPADLEIKAVILAYDVLEVRPTAASLIFLLPPAHHHTHT